MPPKPTPALVYIGDGAFVPNIPARNLSADEAAQYGAAALIATGLYTPASAPDAAAPPPEEPTL